VDADDDRIGRFGAEEERFHACAELPGGAQPDGEAQAAAAIT